VLSEPQFTSTATAQAQGRLNRIGQTEEVNAYYLTSKEIKCEQNLARKIHVRSSIAEIRHAEKLALDANDDTELYNEDDII
jgi:SNF2 family DNA or RNA helicase